MTATQCPEAIGSLNRDQAASACGDMSTAKLDKNAGTGPSLRNPVIFGDIVHDVLRGGAAS